MIRSLRWRMLACLLGTIAVSASLSVVETYNRGRMSATFTEVISMREQLDRALMHIEDRHVRTVRRAREAVRETNAIAVLQWTSQHYYKDMERLVSDARKTVGAVTVHHAEQHLEGDLMRLQRQLDRILYEAQQLTPAFDAMLEATGNDDAAQRAAIADLDRADRSVTTVMRITDGLIRSLCTAQAWHAGAPFWPLSWPLLAILYLLLLVGAALLTLQPLNRLVRIAGSDLSEEHDLQSPPKALTHEESVLTARLRNSHAERTTVAAGLADRSRELERSQAVLRRTENELALLRFYSDNLMNSLRSAIVVTDLTGTVTAFNRVARRLLSLDEALVGQSVEGTGLYRALLQMVPDIQSHLQRALRERQAVRYEAVACGTVLLDLTLAPYQDESGAARGLLWVSDDVTEAVETKHQLLLAERLAAVGRLSAQVAHEIRNPLSAIGLNAELLEEEFAMDLSPKRGAEARQLLHAIAAEIERLTEVTEAYLHLARLPNPQFRRVDVNQIISDLFVMLGEEMKAHHIDVRFDLGSPAPVARCDPGQLHQALLNVVRNSREAMLGGGHIAVCTYTSKDLCVIEISDTGTGIEDDVLPRVFEPFYSTKPHGTGLGLSLTVQIMAEHSGNIDIGNIPPGKGTRVTLTLPIMDMDSDLQQEPYALI